MGGGVGAVLGVDPGAHGDWGVQASLLRIEGGADWDTFRLRHTVLRPLGIRHTDM